MMRAESSMSCGERLSIVTSTVPEAASLSHPHDAATKQHTRMIFGSFAFIGRSI
jgi:hypothetical protein